MHRIRLFPLTKVASMLTHRVNACHAEPIVLKLLAPSFASYPNTLRTTRTTQPYCTYVAKKLRPTKDIVTKVLRKCGKLDYPKYRLLFAGHTLYDSIADGVHYTHFFVELEMEDTFFSWFLITELHTWMMMVRIMAEKDEGMFVRNVVVKAMWDDVNARAKQLGVNSKTLNINVEELSYQFNAALYGYDEGLADDKILAGAIWRRFFHAKGNNPEHLEKLVMYVRKEISMLDKFTRQDILLRPKIKWHDFKDL